MSEGDIVFVRMLRKNAALLLLFTLCLLRFEPKAVSQTTGNAAITLTSIPVWAQTGIIKGKLSGVSPQGLQIYLLMFVPDIGWSDPSNCTPILLNANGEFQVNLDYVAPFNNPLMFRKATRINAYAISSYSQCIQASEAIPFFLDRNAVSKTSVPRLPQYSTISFAGLDWYVKDAPNKVFPGPNFFVKENVFVDPDGKLHLRLSKCGDSWCSAEVFTKDRVGYGTYTVTIDSPLNTLDPNTTLGLFTWDEYNSDNAHMEWDLEFAKWGNASSATNAQYVVQPYTVPGNLQRFSMTAAAPSVHQVIWSANAVSFNSSSSGSSIAQSTISSATTPVPIPGDARLHINYYVGAGSVPSVQVDREIVISALQYSGSAVQTGFSQSAAAVPSYASSRLAGITASNGNCPAFIESDSPWLQVVGSSQITGSGTIPYSVAENTGAARSGKLILHSSSCNLALGQQVMTISQDAPPCVYSFSSGPYSITSDDLLIPISTGLACTWSPVSDSNWLVPVSGATSTGPGNLRLHPAPNVTSLFRTATVTLGGSSLTVVQSPAAACVNSLDAAGATVGNVGANITVNISSSSAQCFWSSYSPVTWASVNLGVVRGSGALSITVGPNFTSTNRSAVLTIAGQPFVVTQTGPAPTAGSRFVPMTPCRILDTRSPTGTFGGPFLLKGATRSVPLAASNCAIPADARAYSLNFTAVPLEGLGFVTAWPSGSPQPFVSTLNSADGSVVANAAIVPAGAGGGIGLYASNATDMVVDINGYFVDASRADALAFYPLTPCRVVDTRNPSGLLGGPAMSASAARSFPIAAAGCGIPSGSSAYSLNYTVVPQGPLAYLTTWPAGQPQPLASTLNSPQGRVLANAAIVPAGSGGSVAVFALSDAPTPTDIVIDVNGHFAPPGPGGLSFYPVAPCRAVDTRPGQGTSGLFGPPSLGKGSTRTFPLPASNCGIPANAAAYSLNVTVVPAGPLSYLTIWPANSPQPFVSTLNSPDGRVLANAAIVPAGANGAVSVYVFTQDVNCDVIIDVNGYFAP